MATPQHQIYKLLQEYGYAGVIKAVRINAKEEIEGAHGEEADKFYDLLKALRRPLDIAYDIDEDRDDVDDEDDEDEDDEPDED